MNWEYQWSLPACDIDNVCKFRIFLGSHGDNSQWPVEWKKDVLFGENIAVVFQVDYFVNRLIPRVWRTDVPIFYTFFPKRRKSSMLEYPKHWDKVSLTKSASGSIEKGFPYTKWAGVRAQASLASFNSLPNWRQISSSLTLWHQNCLSFVRWTELSFGHHEIAFLRLDRWLPQTAKKNRTGWFRELFDLSWFYESHDLPFESEPSDVT